MSYVDLKHLLADLTLEAVRRPDEAGWITPAVAYAELVTEEQPRISLRACLQRAAAVAAPFGWTPSEAALRRLIMAGLFERSGDTLTLPDRFLPHLTYFRRQASRLLRALAELREADPSSGASLEVRIGTALFNAGLFFECHEWFESLWKAVEGERKEFYHGIVQAAAAFYHYEKGNQHGSRTLLRKGRRRLGPYPAHFLGVDVLKFEEDLALWAAHLDGGARPADYPRLRLRTRRGEAFEKESRELRGGNG